MLGLPRIEAVTVDAIRERVQERIDRGTGLEPEAEGMVHDLMLAVLGLPPEKAARAEADRRSWGARSPDAGGWQSAQTLSAVEFLATDKSQRKELHSRLHEWTRAKVDSMRRLAKGENT